MDHLKSSKAEFVPSDGWILAPTEVEFTEGESVHDVLQRVCKEAGIQMESSFTPAYNSAYLTAENFPDGCSASMAGIQTTDAANIL